MKKILFWGMLPFFCLQLCFVDVGKCSDIDVLSLDELLDLEVVSVAKVPGKVTRTPAAITIITGEDLRRSNIQTIPEALRLVPGMHVYQIDANKWAVSARGFASRFSNKMLVMIDGRTVYSTLFSGVSWDVQDVLIEDIDRIEVIRGPGGSLWGANAVNGVVNIITKDSADTQGGLVALQVQTGLGGDVSLRYGGWLNDITSWRVYGKFLDRAHYERPDGVDSGDDWHQGRAGFRTDMNLTARDKLTFEGDIYDGKSGASIKYAGQSPGSVIFDAVSSPVSGGNVLGRWTHINAHQSELILQAYFDHIERDDFFIDETLDTVDLDFQHSLTLTDDLHVLYGGGYRLSKSDTRGKENALGTFSYTMDPQIREDELFSAFVQGRLKVADGRGELTLGSKVEHNDYTGFEWQPSVRFLWLLDDDSSLWAAISRAVRTPSRLESDSTVDIASLAPPVHGLRLFYQLLRNDAMGSEKLFSYEIGYRNRLSRDLFMDLSLYYNRYEDIVAGVADGKPYIRQGQYGRRLTMPVLLSASREEETYGAEVNVNWVLADCWRVTAGYTWFSMNILDANNSSEGRQGFDEDENAEHIFSLVSHLDVSRLLEVNVSLYAISALDQLDIGSRIRLDCNVALHPTERVSVSLGVKNLFDDGTQEFSNTVEGILASDIPRIVYTRLTLNF